MRDVGKALGLPEDLTKMLSSQIWGWSKELDPKQAADLNLNMGDRRLRLALDLARELIGAPRHLSQHPGGFVLTHDRLDELVPIEPAAMVDRQVIEWDKDDIGVLRFMKVDVLALGMLSCMKHCFDLLTEHKGVTLDLATIPAEDPRTYAMIRKADTLGTFQIESRAQMSMLPRIKPRTFYDLVIEVAIVRPGPIQGDMVHPYLRRREGKEKVAYPKPELERVLGKTLGVPLFQEQAMRVAIECAGFTAGEADQLRRAMATFKHTGGVSKFGEMLISGMVANGPEKEFAEKTFWQLEGFAQLRFSGKPCCLVRTHRLRLILDEMLAPGCLLRRPAQRAADGLLCARANRAGRAGDHVALRFDRFASTPRGGIARSSLRTMKGVSRSVSACAWSKAWPTPMPPGSSGCGLISRSSRLMISGAAPGCPPPRWSSLLRRMPFNHH